ncbi:MAG TPA: glycosyltransferase family 2 protein [Chloroflexota bacterium]
MSIVSYRTPALLRQSLAALDAQRQSVSLEVTVVDNASGDRSADMVADQFPWVHLIRNPRNVGFGAAHNQAMRRAQGRYWLILNSDATPSPGALGTLVGFMDANPTVAVAGPGLRYPDGTRQSSRRRFPTLATLFLESTQLQRFCPNNAILRRYYVQDRPDGEPQDVDWLVGACLCVRPAAARQVGLFDERFFMYSEEIDWCRRFRAAGWRISYVPAAEVVHHEGGSSRLDLGARDQLFQASKLEYARKWHGRSAAGALRAYLIVEYLARGFEEALKLSVGSRVAERRARLRLIRGGLWSTLHPRLRAADDRGGPAAR